MRFVFTYLMLLSCTVYAQKTYINADTIYYDKDWQEIAYKDSAVYFRSPAKKLSEGRYVVEDYYISTGKLQMKVVYNSRRLKDGNKTYYFENGTKQSEGAMINEIANGLWKYYSENGSKKSEGHLKNGRRNGLWIDYHKNGQIAWSAQFKNEKFHGEVLQYYTTGTLRRREIYKFGKMISGNCYTRTGTDTSYFSDHSVPRFPGGDDKFEAFIFNNPIYLKFQETNQIHSEVLINVLFDEKGRITNANLERRVHPTLDATAMQLIMTMPNWIPAEDEDGRRISSSRVIDIDF